MITMTTTFRAIIGIDGGFPMDCTSILCRLRDAMSPQSDRNRGHRNRRRICFHSFALLAIAGSASATEISVDGTYGTIAMCIIDAFTDVPSAEINYNVGGAPLARVMPGEFDTPAESCTFQTVVTQTESATKPSWDVEASCTGRKGNASRRLKITSDKENRTVSVRDSDGVLLATLDQCAVPYGERLSRELKRMPPAHKK
jgi:hypothetical protein